MWFLKNLSKGKKNGTSIEMKNRKQFDDRFILDVNSFNILLKRQGLWGLD